MARIPYIVAGHVAVLPWTVLHLLAAAPLATTLSSYYAFPFMMASFWPLAAAHLGPRPLGATPSETERRSVDRVVAALVAAKPTLGRLLVDGSVLALAPDDFAWREIVFAGER